MLVRLIAILGLSVGVYDFWLAWQQKSGRMKGHPLFTFAQGVVTCGVGLTLLYPAIGRFALFPSMIALVTIVFLWIRDLARKV